MNSTQCIQVITRDNTVCQFTEVHPVLNYHANKDPSWTVKGLIETSRCIGYAYMKKALFTMARSFVIPMREQVIFGRPLLTSEPDVYSKVLKDTDSFIIFGSSGFWKLITNDYAAEIVNSSPRDDIAKILAVIAIEKGARKKKTKYSNIVEIPKGEHVDGCWGVQHQRSRPVYHNDIIVIVVFFDNKPSSVRPEISCYTCSDFPDTPSENCIHGAQMINEFAARIVNTGPRDNIPNLKDMFESLLLSRRQIWWFFPETVHY
ncbi:hypothetical protein KIW84_053641 [Lathyrus oleraceus]|uniref:PPM-type phosphatase domain-containing protein n=1 Tax=Pisum sativum TaxID=3888 RepID=A0A9D4WVH4_PEA|nr:hypothetical protein KIW84_053641 [Pisum sativum]